MWFTFANDGIPTGGLPRLNEEERKVRAVARLLVRHPRLRVRIHGYGQPEAPPQIGEALAQSRAMNVRTLLLRMLVQFDSTAWQDEADSDEEEEEAAAAGSAAAWGFPPGRNRTRVVGHRVQAVGRWPHQPESIYWA